MVSSVLGHCCLPCQEVWSLALLSLSPLSLCLSAPSGQVTVSMQSPDRVAVWCLGKAFTTFLTKSEAFCTPVSWGWDVHMHFSVTHLFFSPFLGETRGWEEWATAWEAHSPSGRSGRCPPMWPARLLAPWKGQCPFRCRSLWAYLTIVTFPLPCWNGKVFALCVLIMTNWEISWLFFTRISVMTFFT